MNGYSDINIKYLFLLLGVFQRLNMNDSMIVLYFTGLVCVENHEIWCYNCSLIEGCEKSNF